MHSHPPQLRPQKDNGAATHSGRAVGRGSLRSFGVAIVGGSGPRSLGAAICRPPRLAPLRSARRAAPIAAPFPLLPPHLSPFSPLSLSGAPLVRRGLLCPRTPAAPYGRRRRALAPQLPTHRFAVCASVVGRPDPACRRAKAPASPSPADTLGLPCAFPGRSLPLVANALGKRTTFAHNGNGALVVAGSACSLTGAPPPPNPRASLRSGLRTECSASGALTSSPLPSAE